MWSAQYPVTNHGRKTAAAANQSHNTSTLRAPEEAPGVPQLAFVSHGGLNSDKSVSSLKKDDCHRHKSESGVADMGIHVLRIAITSQPQTGFAEEPLADPAIKQS
jgi:hypothetical protein